ncbi:MAG: 3'-5' exonuclease [Patescibacteria group bacterium]|jgi:DNA polymerase III epsilon subunit family exonuclease
MTPEEQKQKYQNFLETEFSVFDLETSGLYPDKDEILEIAALKLRGKEIVDRFEELVRPTKSVPTEAEKVHGLNEIYLIANGRKIDDVMKEFFHFIGDSIVVGHNIREFDWLFILDYCRKRSLPMPENKMIDTLELSRKILTLPSYTLGNVAKHFGYEHINAHRAMPDVEFNAKIFIELMERLLNKN